jgi:hypothetical protein
MNKKGIIGIASACVAGVGVLLSYLEAKGNEEFLGTLEKRLSDVEKFYDDGSNDEAEAEVEADTES